MTASQDCMGEEKERRKRKCSVMMYSLVMVASFKFHRLVA